MFAVGYRTPVKDASPTKNRERSPPKNDEQPMEKPGPSTNKTKQTRRSIGETETKKRLSSSPQAVAKLPPKQGEKKTISAKTNEPANVNRVAEAKACVVRAKLAINNSRNLKTDIKNDVLDAIDRLFSLVKESEANDLKLKGTKLTTAKEQEKDKSNCERLDKQLLEKMEEHNRLLLENKEEITRIGMLVQSSQKQVTYASAVKTRHYPLEGAAMHSVVVTSKVESETGDQVLEKIRKAVNAREEGVRIDRLRKARDRKVILGCQTQKEITRVKEKLKESEGDLCVEDVQNKNPQIILKHVMNYLTDDEIVGALQTQNKNLFKGENEEVTSKIRVKYRRRTRNPHMTHVILTVPPTIWRRLTDTGTVHMDLQRVRVEDQSPLVQCSRCLGYGHSRKYCSELLDVCSHCGGPHMKAECADWMAGVAPSCINCSKSKLDGCSHNAFEDICPVRRKWENLARSVIAYC